MDLNKNETKEQFAKEYSKGKSSSAVFTEQHEKDFIAGFEKALNLFSTDKWISVKDKMPENRQIVIIYWEYQGVKKITSGSYNQNGDYWQHGAATQLKVTHWMPLPEPPKNKL